ncbi:MAG TPA: multicopper oxidase family protein [Paracoccaceae bacterium]|nr:multicopper oxidase family protein [Paracoccaceae bacterium]
MAPLSRRALITTGLCASGFVPLLSQMVSGGPSSPISLSLAPGPARYPLTGAAVTEAMMSYAADAPPPVLRLRQGQPARISVLNNLSEITTVHWHGVRVPFAQDGVPWLTQVPIGPGETYVYDFTPPDAGTYWYHPHCNTLEQIARGLAGVLIVDEAEDQAFDADIAVLVRDFRLGKDGQFIAFASPRNMARGGTFGTVSTADWAVDPVISAPAGGLVRLRLVVTDVTRVYDLSLQGAEAMLVALDGQPLVNPEALSEGLLIAPGQRADLVVRMPDLADETVSLVMRLRGKEERVLARLVASGPSLSRRLADLRPLPPNPTALPDLAQAEALDFVFGWSPEGNAPESGGFCGDVPYRFWSINRQVFGGDAPPDPARPGTPLAELRLGKSYRFRLRNETQNDHPIHLHGFAMHLIGPDGKLTGQARDTILLRSHDVTEVAVLADNPGDWVFHCHVIEHQKTGLAGIIRVS